MLQKVDTSVISIEEYRSTIGSAEADRLIALSEPLRGARIVHINATQYGGGVSELLRSTIAIQRGLGIDIEWRVISGESRFFEITKKIHNGLQGASQALTTEETETYLIQNSYNARRLEGDYDFVFVHDPQPAPLRSLCGRRKAKWIWRCHIDTSRPNDETLNFLLPYIETYDALVFTMDAFVPRSLRDQRVHIIPPAIDPLSPKNFALPDEHGRRILEWVGIDPRRPLITQVSRFDPWKDPLGVIRVYQRVREVIPGLQIALLGSMALDDPEGWAILKQIQQETEGNADITVATNLTGIGNIEINVFQRHSNVVVQKSIREGFGLIVSETLWKGTPIVAGNSGGIPMQMPDGAGGYLVDPRDEELFADRVISLLEDPEAARTLAARGREVIKAKFLITRLVADELTLLANAGSA
jgi:trehalose synthase